MGPDERTRQRGRGMALTMVQVKGQVTSQVNNQVMGPDKWPGDMLGDWPSIIHHSLVTTLLEEV